MANPGVGSKFVSVNLNKSYGQRSSSSGNLGGGASRTHRSGGGVGVGGGGSGNGGGGGGGGMVVLSRSRSSIVGVQKGGPKLSVPPPLNLPSLRREHERSDPSSSGGSSAGAGNSGVGARPTSSGIGWTKPAPSLLQEKDSGNDHPLSGVGSPRINASDLSRGNSVYMPPSARTGLTGPSVAVPTNDIIPVHRAVVLRGEDFPSLQATLPAATGISQKQKDVSNQKQSQTMSGDSNEQLGNSYLRPPFVMQPQNQSSRLVGKVPDEKEGVNHSSSGSRSNEQLRKQDDFFPSPLPLVRLNHTSDWADDERDTGHGIPDRDRDKGYSRNEFIRDREFEYPRSTLPPRTLNHNHSEGRSVHHDEAGRPPSGGYLKGNTYNRDVRSPSREGRDGSSWRSPSLMKDGYGVDRNGIGGRPLGVNRGNGNENKFGQSHFGDGTRDGFNSGFPGAQDSRFGRRDAGYGQGIRQAGNYVAESYGGRGAEQTKPDYHDGNLPNRNRGDSFQNGSLKKASGRGPFLNDPVLNIGREKRLTSGKQYPDEPYLKDLGSGTDFDGRDPLTGTLVGVLKRKKDVLKQADYHDPVRESFEAELERVQKLQEQERQRLIDEQARALELARKEEEERERIAREEEERRRRIEDEVREAAWRAEQERLEAARKAEEQKVAREEEKRRMMLEEERRKEAARKKLMELEERIARRQAEVSKENEFSSGVRDDRMPGLFHEKDPPRVADVVDWEDGERMVERITSSASSDSSSFNRSFEMNSRLPFYRDGDSAFLDRGRPSNSWRRDAFESGNSSNFIWQDQDNGFRSPKRDTYGAGRAFARKEFNGGPGTIPTKASAKGGVPESLMDDFPQPRGNRWNLGGELDPYSRNSDVDPEFHDNFVDRFNDIGWGFGRPRASHHPSYPERIYQSSDNDGFSSFGKSRHSMRQPRVLPPPSLGAVNKNTFRSQIDPPNSSEFGDSEMSYHHASRKSEPVLQTGYEPSYQEELDQPRMVGAQRESISCQDPVGANTTTTTTPRCDSQSSLSVSSPPSSPTHLSHDDLEENSGASPVSPTAEEGKEHLSDDEHDYPVTEVRTIDNVGPSSALSVVEDDEEWEIENHQDLPEQEEYDDEENGFREEDEVHEVDDENGNLHQEFENMHLDEKDASSRKDQLVLGFNENDDVVIASGVDLEQLSACASEEARSLDGLVGVGQNLQSAIDSLNLSVESPKMADGADKTPVNVDIEPVSAVDSAEAPASLVQGSEAAAGDDHICVDVSSSMSAPPHKPHTASVDLSLPSSSTELAVSTVSSGTSQTEVPVKLQFGLFSGPSLIPSPVQAIQIGSIQMPLHLHHQVGPSLSQLHPPQPPFFQFGQLRYASPISQGILPLGPQSMSFVQPSVPASYSFNQNQNDSLNNQEGKDSHVQTHSARDKLPSVSADNNIGVQKLLDQSQEDPNKGGSVLSVTRAADNEVMVANSRAESSFHGERNTGSESISHVDQRYQYFDGKKNYRSNVNNKEWQGQHHAEPTTSQYMSKAPGPMSGNKGKRYVYTVKNSGSRSSLPVSEFQQTEFRGPQRRARSKLPRTEFRVRENFDKRQAEALPLSKFPESEKSSFSGRLSGTSVQSGVREADVGAGSKMDKQLEKEVPSKKGASHYISHSREGNSKRNNSFDEDVDAPLQSGIVRVFKQPGIEAPSDEDDFIEVRSKRQMLNDRREQREKEIKAKSRIIKAPRKRRSVSQNNMTSAISNKTSTPSGREAPNRAYFKSVIGESLERSARFTNTIVSPPLAPIGTPSANPSLNTDAQTDMRPYTTKSPQIGSVPVISNDGTSLVPSLSFENQTMLLDSVPTSLSPWGNARVNQQVMALTQTQLDEAMKPARFEKHADTNKLSSSSVTPDRSFSSTVSPLNSLLAGEKIQFGAVTSPTILPPSSHVTSSGLTPPDSIDHNLSALEKDCALFFDKDKHINESCVDLGDSEAEAEAAASAVAVAAISSDEIVGSGCSASVSETKCFGNAENQGLSSEGRASDSQLSQSRGEESSLSVALPADLSVETPALSLWPSLPSPQHSSGQLLPHFPPPSHFPCYEMNPMLGGPIFAFGPHDETSGTQPQSQKTNASGPGPGPGPLGAWQQCHSGVDSFYGPPAGFTGPFISPSGVQGPPHMVVYNHFTPVGQFGQVGLSFMGTTYIPSGKQPDWKHNPGSIGEGDINMNMAPGSPLLPMASPLAMFDMSPFQSPGEVPRWSHFSAPLSMPLQHVEGVPSQYNHMSHSSTMSNFSNSGEASSTTVTQFPDELGLMDTSNTTTTTTTVAATTSGVPVSRPPSYSSSITNGSNQSANLSKTQSIQYHQRVGSGGEWTQSRRMGGFQGRNQSSVTDKKVKQIYVAKPSTSRTSS